MTKSYKIDHSCLSSRKQLLPCVHIFGKWKIKKESYFYYLVDSCSRLVIQVRYIPYNEVKSFLNRKLWFFMLFFCDTIKCRAKAPHSLRLGTEKEQRKFWERRISLICLCSKYVKNCNIFGQILNIWVRLILKKIHFFSIFSFA